MQQTPNTPISTDPLERATQNFLHQVGSLMIYLIGAVRFILQGKVSLKHTLAQVVVIGYDSLPMTTLICVIAGSVLALQTADKFAQTGADAYVGGLVAIAIVREIAPIFACLAVGARAGTAIASEVANMKVSNQVDALEVMHVNPVRYLMVPRLIAAVISLPFLTLIGEVISIVSGMIIAYQVSHLHMSKYMESVWLYLAPYDVEVSLLKAAIFGLVMACIACTVGLNAKGGAREVGLSTTRAVVATAITIIVIDFFLTWVFFGTTYERDF